MIQKRRSIFNKTLEKENEEDNILDKEVNSIISDYFNIDSLNEKNKDTFLKQKDKLIKYSVQTKLKFDREIRLVTYIIESNSKTQAGKLGRDKLFENGYEKDKIEIISSRVNKAKSNDKDSDILFERIKIDYEVIFNIKIDDQRFKKVFIIKAISEDDARKYLDIRCKKEFGNYRSITKVEIREATKNSKESSELIEPAVIVPLETKENKSEQKTEKLKSYKEIAENFIREELDNYFKNIPNELQNKKIVSVCLTSKDKVAKDLIKEHNMGKCYFDTSSIQEAREMIEDKRFYKETNRSLRRKIKNTYLVENFVDCFKDATKELTNKMLEVLPDSEEFTTDFSDNDKEDLRKTLNETLDDFLKDFQEKIKLNCDKEETEEELDKKFNTKFKTSTEEAYDSLEAICEEGSDKIIGLRKKQILPLANPEKFRVVIKTNDSVYPELEVYAQNKDEALKMTLTGISGKLLGNIDETKVEHAFIYTSDGKLVGNADVKILEKKGD